MSKAKEVIRVENISKIYNLGETVVTALNNVNLKIESGEFISIVGKSGSGKSTLMHILGLLDTPTTGKIYIEETETSKLKESQLAKLRNKYIGFVFQQFNLLARTSAEENVELPLMYANISPKRRKEIAVNLLTKLDMQDRLANQPSQLSGGQRQRVAIARALANDPSIIFADEPTGNLDSKTGKEVLKIFRELNNEGKTIVLVTHDQSIAEVADRIITIADGQIVEDTRK